MQADPNIDGVTSTQGYNRYSYVHNNPLNATDPTGYFKLRQVVGLAVAAVFTWATGGVGAGAFASSYFGAATIGAVSGAAGAIANGGDIFQGALIGGVSALAFSAIGNQFSNGGVGPPGPGQIHFGGNLLSYEQVALQIGEHALAGGVIAELQGGKFGHGFASAGFTKGVLGSAPGMSAARGNVVGRLALYTVVGGTASRITGGKFANGATTAAFQFLFNESSKWAKKVDELLDSMANTKRTRLGNASLSEGKWKFQAWSQNRETNLWHDYRMTDALCVCGGENLRVNVLYEQWRPISINTLEVPSAGQKLSGVHSTSAIDAAFDLGEAVQRARSIGATDQGTALINSSPNVGEGVCNNLGVCN